MSAKPFPLNAFESLADGQPIAAVQGVLIKLFDQKDGTNSVGAWTLQNGELEADGVIVPITFKDRPVMDKSMKGKTILVTAAHEKQMSGIYCWDDKKNGATVRKIKVTASATVDIINGDSSPAAQQPHQQQGQTSLQNPQSDPNWKEGEKWQGNSNSEQQKPAGKAAEKSKEDQELHEARRTINQIANLHLLCMLAVERYEADAFKTLTGRDMPESQRQAAVASIFIKADREGLVRYMPVTDASKDPRFVLKKGD